jgi:hypothetical protein
MRCGDGQTSNIGRGGKILTWILLDHEGNWTTVRKVVNKMHHRLGLSLTLDSFQVPAHRHRSTATLRFSYPVSDCGLRAKEKIAESESRRLKGRNRWTAADDNSKQTRSDGKRTSGFSGSASSARPRLGSDQLQLRLDQRRAFRLATPSCRKTAALF